MGRWEPEDRNEEVKREGEETDVIQRLALGAAHPQATASGNYEGYHRWKKRKQGTL